MEPLTTAAIAIGSIVATKALEKTGEKATETLWEQIGKFLNSLKQQSPDTVTAIEKAPEQPLDYGKAVLEVESAAKANPQVAQTMAELVTTVEAESNPRLDELLKAVKETLASQQPMVQNNTKLAEKINNVIQAQIVYLTQHITF